MEPEPILFDVRKRMDIAHKMTKTMNAWVLGDPGQLSLVNKPVPTPGVAVSLEQRIVDVAIADQVAAVWIPTEKERP